jgi:hypothetical protein
VHNKAKAWDVNHGAPDITNETAYVEWAKQTDRTYRPCDWCGEPLEKNGFIHDECLEKEKAFWIELVN